MKLHLPSPIRFSVINGILKILETDGMSPERMPIFIPRGTTAYRALEFILQS
jgi:hypothetical protein